MGLVSTIIVFFSGVFAALLLCLFVLYIAFLVEYHKPKKIYFTQEQIDRGEE